MPRLFYKPLKFRAEMIELYVPATSVCLDAASICEEFCQDWKYLLESETRIALLVPVRSWILYFRVTLVMFIFLLFIFSLNLKLAQKSKFNDLVKLINDDLFTLFPVSILL